MKADRSCGCSRSPRRDTNRTRWRGGSPRTATPRRCRVGRTQL